MVEFLKYCVLSFPIEMTKTKMAIFSWLNNMLLLSLSIDDVSFGMLAVVLGVSPILYKSKKLGEARTPPNLEQ